MTLLKLLALINISGTRKMELGRSQLVSHSHVNCVPEITWPCLCLWALPDTAQHKMQLVRDAPKGRHVKEIRVLLRIQTLCRAPSLVFIRRKNLPGVFVGTACFLAPQASVVPTPVDWSCCGCNIEKQPAPFSSNLHFLHGISSLACTCMCVWCMPVIHNWFL